MHRELSESISRLPPALRQKICFPEAIAQTLGELARPLVFTNGCFDLFHAGHASYLAQAQDLGRSLVVALNTDASISGLNKPGNRPINPLACRLAVVAALESVTRVTWFDTATPLELILNCRPDILVKGEDWQDRRIVGADEVSALGGKVYSIPFLFLTSTTQIIKRIQASNGASHSFSI